MSQGIIGGNVISIEVRNIVLDMPQISANTTEENTFTVDDLLPGDFVAVSKSDLDVGIIYGSSRVSAVNTLAIQCTNPTAGAVDPASETVKLLVVRNTAG